MAAFLKAGPAGTSTLPVGVEGLGDMALTLAIKAAAEGLRGTPLSLVSPGPCGGRDDIVLGGVAFVKTTPGAGLDGGATTPVFAIDVEGSGDTGLTLAESVPDGLGIGDIALTLAISAAAVGLKGMPGAFGEVGGAGVRGSPSALAVVVPSGPPGLSGVALSPGRADRGVAKALGDSDNGVRGASARSRAAASSCIDGIFFS
eukprot:Blabericola_migrator_1__10192@NODE_569_length_7540_cov_46_110130_g424_i0_p3_GENE_NODE_569_length_7540_cov_46_110130_g424_i0NODE_569_length_7540_cov_46_110130_g424_i0_p3_ORF_typecomplete_len202_score25_84Collagen/PF01391_18/3_7e03Collagen/PF01391_18/1_9e03Collagen/PF01391_18/0_016_NODE_569_length_7540_cov_46_110130_g424_i054006005